MPFRSPFPDVVIPEVPLHELLYSDAPAAPQRTAMVDGVSGQSVSYGELGGLVDRFAGALAARGIGRGDVVAVFAPNTPYYPVVFHGILRAGAVATTVNSLYTPGELATQLVDSRARLLVTVSPFLDRADAAVAADGVAVTEVVVMDGAPGRASLPDLLSEAAPAPTVSVSPDDLAVLPYSSGTTGKGKGVMLTHRNLVANVAQCERVFRPTEHDRLLAVLPFFHIYGMTVLLNHGLRIGATVVTLPRFDLEAFLRAIQTHRINRVYIAPPVAVALAKHPMVDDFDLSSVDIVFSGAAALDAGLAQQVADRIGCRVRQGYGMTEMSPVSHAVPDDRDDIPLGSVGPTVPNMTCKIVDVATGEEVTGTDIPGELWCAGPNVMSGYLGDPVATAATLDGDGYLHTGDIATLDAAGNLTIVDRVKELIKYKGYQVPPAELEALLLNHPRIADAAVIGVLDADGEEVPKAFVVRQAGEALGADDVIAYVAAAVAPYKKVRVVEFVDAIPKSASGKILRKDLRAAERSRQSPG